MISVTLYTLMTLSLTTRGPLGAAAASLSQSQNAKRSVTPIARPDLIYDNHPVGPPCTPEQGYRLTEDLTDKAIEYIAGRANAGSPPQGSGRGNPEGRHRFCVRV
jgi:hypothetical protein